MRARRLLVPGLTTLVMLAILLSLGVWQLHRLTWKRGLLADIAAAEARPAIPLEGDPPPFAKVVVRGKLRADLAALYGSQVRQTRDGARLGGQLIEPLERADGPPILVDLGWIPNDRPRALAPQSGEISVEGYARAPDHTGPFSATDDTTMRLFYTLDPDRIGAALGLAHVAPFTLIALGATPPEGYPDPAHRLPRPPNDHLQYAITWFGLAVVLLVIFALYARKVLRP